VGGAGTVDDLIAERWAKLTVNCYGNALGGISGLSSAALPTAALPIALGTKMSAEEVMVEQVCVGF
jgi:hypothetical protein